MIYDNKMTLKFSAKSQNEAFARMAAVAFITSLDPLLNEITEIKTAVSEAVTNSIIHGYENKDGEITLRCGIIGRDIYIEIEDNGIGIEDIAKAREPLYTSKPEMERSGMGFTVMETFMDDMEIFSESGTGTKIKMHKKLSGLDISEN